MMVLNAVHALQHVLNVQGLAQHVLHVLLANTSTIVNVMLPVLLLWWVEFAQTYARMDSI